MIGEKLLSQKAVSLSDVKELLSGRKKEKDLTYEQDLTSKYAKRFCKLSPAEAEKLQNELGKIPELNDVLAAKIADLLPERMETLQLLILKEAKVSDEAVQKILALCKKFRK